jgi:hypothetical protein
VLGVDRARGKAIRNANYQDSVLWLIAQSLDPVPDLLSV